MGKLLISYSKIELYVLFRLGVVLLIEKYIERKAHYYYTF